MLTLQFCTLVVEQARVFLKNLSTLDDSRSSISSRDVLERKSLILPNSMIGRHLRHVEERLRKVLDVIEHPTRETLSYEWNRKLDSTPMPPISVFQNDFNAIRDRIASLPESSFRNSVSIRRETEVIESTALRELYGAAFHAIHHFAIMGALLREILGTKDAEKYIPPKFGFKPKTSIGSKL